MRRYDSAEQIVRKVASLSKNCLRKETVEVLSFFTRFLDTIREIARMGARKMPLKKISFPTWMMPD